MKIKKNLGAAALALLASVSLAACGGTPADQMSASPSDKMMAPSDKMSNDKMGDDKMMSPSMSPSDGMSMHPSDKMSEGKMDGGMMKPAKYVTQEDWMQHKDAYKDTKQVLFFAASWCPNCKAIDKALLADQSVIPDGVTVVKVDYDKATDLRKQYEVTMQHTFVQIDAMGKEVAQWTATEPADVLKGLKG